MIDMKVKGNSPKIVLRLAIASVFTALVCIATLVFTVGVPATSGYFNIGETIIYVAALLFGPYVGAFAGGLGAAIADMLVAPVFFPGTLAIKSCEGAIVGFLNKKMFTQTSRSNWRIYTALLGVVVGVLLAVTGSVYYRNVDIYLGIPAPPTPTFTVFIPAEVWYFLGGILAFLITLTGFKLEPESGRAILSIIIGGLVMITGYFLYEQLVLNKAAVVEIPVNIGQMLVGLIVAIPVVRIVLRSLPQLKS